MNRVFVQPSLRIVTARWDTILFRGVASIGFLSVVATGLAHDPFIAKEVRFSTPGADVAGTLLLPETSKEVPCVVITTKVEKEFMDYLKGLAVRLEQERNTGTPFLLKELPKDHPARQFAREANPKFDEESP